MKIVLSGIESVMDTDCEMVNALIIENQRLLTSLLNELQFQMDGTDGRCVLSEDGKILGFDKNAEMLSSFFPFTLNKKSLLNKLSSAIEKKAINADFYGSTVNILSEVEQYLEEVTFDFTGDIIFDKISISSLIKASGMCFRDDYDRLGEKILDYIELVTEYDRKKLFIMLNLRSYIDDSEMEYFMKEVLQRKYHVLMIESSEHKKLLYEKRTVVDAFLCEIVY